MILLIVALVGFISAYVVYESIMTPDEDFEP